MIKKFLQILFFSQYTPLAKLGEKKILDAEDLPPLPQQLDPVKVSELFNGLNYKSSKLFFISIMTSLKKVLVIPLLFITLILLGQLMAPIALHGVIAQIQESFVNRDDFLRGILAIALLTGSNIFTGMMLQYYIHHALKMIIMVTSGMGGLVYKKALRISHGGMGQTSVGDIINHLGNDSGRIGDSIWAWIELVYAILAFVAVTIMSYHYLGVAAIAGIATLLFLSPVLKLITKRFIHYDEKLMEARDRRVNLISQIISGMRVVKYFVWEQRLGQEVIKERGEELAAQRNLAKTVSLSTLLFVATQTLTCLVAFGVALYLGHELTPGIVFAVISLFSILDHPFGRLSDHLALVMEGLVASRRIFRFLNLEEVQSKATDVTFQGHHAIIVHNFSAWYYGKNLPCLDNINLQIPWGAKTAIVGPVGAGKSSLLRGILNEIPNIKGKVAFNPRIKKLSLVPQEAFILNRSLQENIRFGSPLNQINASIALAQMEQDICAMPQGLETEIGEHGVNLSGGQKQRLNLARAINSDADLYLLDDALSAVDPHTEDAIVDQLICDFWKEKTCIVATHRLRHIHKFDQIVFMDYGRIEAIDDFDTLMKTNAKFQHFMASHGVVDQPVSQAEVQRLPQSQDSTEYKSFNDDEDREEGAVAKTVYWDYFKALCGRSRVEKRVMGTLLLLSAILGGLAPIAHSVWLSFWVDGQIKEPWFAWNYQDIVPWQLVIYGGLSMLTVLFTYLQFRIWAMRAVRAGEILHEDAFNAVMKSPIGFFDRNPTGRILNRFSKDMDAVEKEMPWNLLEMIACSLSTIVAFGVMLWFIPYAVLVVVPLCFVFYRLQNLYRATARENKRLYSMSRSPLFGHFKETLDGLESIRAYGKERVFEDEFLDALRENQRMFWGMVVINRWFSLRIPLVSGIVTMTVGLGVLYLSYLGWLQAGLAGLTLLYSTRFAIELSFAVRCFSEVETRLTSVERLRFYGQLPTEQDQVIKNQAVWSPKSGSMELRNVQFRYTRELPLVLKGVSIKVPHGIKVGIVGRTGSGKSTIFQCLFRFVDIESGNIFIDGTDTRTIPLQQLRKKLAIIPQDPTLFLGSIRDNLDRFKEYSDAELWLVLEHVQLADFVHHHGGLEGKVTEGGHNFSRGQRQLFCFARALLIDAPIICLDEATASVDVVTDRIIQTVMDQYCQNKTILIIAHRLGTVSHCDMVVQLDDGRVSHISYNSQSLMEQDSAKYEKAKNFLQLMESTSIEC